MSKLSFMDKIGILVNESKNSKIYLILIVVLLITGIILIKTNKSNEKKNKIIFISIAIISLLSIILSFYNSLGKLMNYMMNHFFIGIFFPNIAMYFAAIIVTNIILWISLFNYKSSKQIKLLNIIVYMIINYLMFLLLKIIKVGNIDIYSQSSIYENESANAIISLTSTVFIIWIVFLIIYKILLIYLKKDYKEKIKKVVIKKSIKKLPDNYESIEIPKIVYKKSNSNLYLNDIQMKKQLENMLTLEDYKTLIKILNEHKKTKRKKEQEEKELKIYKELLELYELH